MTNKRREMLTNVLRSILAHINAEKHKVRKSIRWKLNELSFKMLGVKFLQ